jgi:hypothetical protein
MLSSPVYTEAHPRRIAAHTASCNSLVFSNSFASYPFRTLSSHFQTPCPSIPFAIKHFRTLCKIPGIGYPPSLYFSRLFLDSIFPIFPCRVALCERTNCALLRTKSFASHTCAFHGGRGGSSHLQVTQTGMVLFIPFIFKSLRTPLCDGASATHLFAANLRTLSIATGCGGPLL